jgi:hypothetical protein
MSIVLLSHLAAVSLATLFGLAGLLHLAAPRALLNGYRRWQFAPSFHYVAGVAHLFAALLLAIPQLRVWGGILGAMILFVTVVSLLNHRKYAYAVPAILAMLAIAPAMVGQI